MLQAPIKRNRDRVKPKKVTPVRIAAASKSGSVLTVTFDQPVVLKGTPNFRVDVVNADPVSAAMTSPTVMTITYDIAITAATKVTIAFEDPAVRSAVGGYVADSTFPVA